MMIPIYLYCLGALGVALVCRRRFQWANEDVLLAAIAWPAHLFFLCLLGVVGLLLAPFLLTSMFVRWSRDREGR